MISIITSTYNSDKYLKKYLDSIKSELRNIECEILIISNDTNEVENEILKENANIPNLRIIKVPRENLYESWNRGIKESKGDYITFWNVDDIRFSNALKKGIFKLKSKKCDIAYFPFIYKRYINIFKWNILMKIKKIDPIFFNREKFKKEMHCGPFFIFTKNAFKKNGAFDNKMKIAGDFDWCARAAKKNLKFIKVNMVAGIFKNNGKTLSGSKNPIQEKENQLIYERNK